MCTSNDILNYLVNRFSRRIYRYNYETWL